MEELVNDRLLPGKVGTESDRPSSSIPASSVQLDREKTDREKTTLGAKTLNVSGPVKPYHPGLKNFWYPFAFTADLKSDTMVCIAILTWFVCLFLFTSIWEILFVYVLRCQLSALRNHGLSLGERMGNRDVYRTRVRIERVLFILARWTRGVSSVLTMVSSLFSVLVNISENHILYLTKVSPSRMGILNRWEM